MTKRKFDINDFVDTSQFYSDDEDNRQNGSLKKSKVTETSTDHDPNVTVEEPVENAADPESSQPESSNAQNTGSDPANPYTDATTEEDLVSSETKFDTETSVDPDPNAHVEEPVENAPDPRSSQARSSEAQNTGNDQGVQECRRGGCISPVVPGMVHCEEHRRQTNEHSV